MLLLFGARLASKFSMGPKVPNVFNLVLPNVFQVNKSREIAEKDGVTIPTTEEDYTKHTRGKQSSSHHLSLGSSMDIEENSNMVRI